MFTLLQKVSQIQAEASVCSLSQWQICLEEEMTRGTAGFTFRTSLKSRGVFQY